MESILSRKGVSLLISLMFLSACSGSSGTTTTSSGGGVTSIDNLPFSTSPVVATESAGISKNMVQLAETGVPLGEFGDSTFDSNSSKAMCELTNRFREAIGSAAFGDLILCYVTKLIAANPSSDINMEDGNPHVVALDFGEGGEEEGGGGPSKVRLTIVKNADGQITDFTMQACGDGEESEDTQTEYLNQTIGADGSFTMNAKGFHSHGGEESSSGAHQIDVTGTLVAGQFTSKTITIAYSYAGDSFTGEGTSTVVQGADTLTLTGFESGSFSFEDQQAGSVTGTFSSQVYSLAELINGNTSGEALNIGLYAIGDGAAKVQFIGSDDAFGSWNELITEGWDGDTTAVDSEATQLSSVTDQTVPEISDINIAFTETETWDCSDAAELTIVVDQTILDAQCSNLDLGHGYVRCHDLDE